MFSKTLARGERPLCVPVNEDVALARGEDKKVVSNLTLADDYFALGGVHFVHAVEKLLDIVPPMYDPRTGSPASIDEGATAAREEPAQPIELSTRGSVG
eukprot:CAMPEP_0185546978 /NCGR_PEP_ID=MMETSP1381-20130426/5822_1 /TAXON_ID=298111 /ORGANISM="Pavlova sp., Strain CCMP459" /LENGTH=98 /DNA_ID=CAMNT_0028159481 /DNA_START=95 /DNA_END=392 /DNA_ORIENTATION=+